VTEATDRREERVAYLRECGSSAEPAILGDRLSFRGYAYACELFPVGSRFEWDGREWVVTRSTVNWGEHLIFAAVVL
jgi:hypothetical protein